MNGDISPDYTTANFAIIYYIHYIHYIFMHISLSLTINLNKFEADIFSTLMRLYISLLNF